MAIREIENGRLKDKIYSDEEFMDIALESCIMHDLIMTPKYKQLMAEKKMQKKDLQIYFSYVASLGDYLKSLYLSQVELMQEMKKVEAYYRSVKGSRREKELVQDFSKIIDEEIEKFVPNGGEPIN